MLCCIVAWRCAFQHRFETRPLTSPDNKTNMLIMDRLRKINSCHVESRYFSLIFFYLWGCKFCSVLLQCHIHGFVSGIETSYLVLSDLAVMFIQMILGNIFLHLKNSLTVKIISDYLKIGQREIASHSGVVTKLLGHHLGLYHIFFFVVFLLIFPFKFTSI